MRMIPSQPHDTKSCAEQKVFNKFLASTVMGKNAVCLHSLNIANHINQRFGEADFVMICKHGLFVFEVKGGLVSRDVNGVWHFRDRYGKDHTTRRGPFVQAGEALYSIRNKIKDELGQEVINRICLGFGVIIPDSSFDFPGVEWDLRTVLSVDSFHRFSAWLAQFIVYWVSRDKRRTRKQLSPEEIELIKTLLRPEISHKTALFLDINGINGINGTDGINERITTLTQNQFYLLDVADFNQRVIFKGGAGTGKRQMALELAQRLAKKGKTVLFLSPSLWLIRFLQSRIFNRSVTFSTFREIMVKGPKTQGPRFDILVINGCDREFSIYAIDCLDDTLKDGFSKGRWYLFQDINLINQNLNQNINQNINQTINQGQIENRTSGLFQYLISLKPAQIPLKKNCRHTTPILQAIKSLTRFNPGEDGTGHGPDVQVIHPDSTPEEALARELKRLVNTEAIPLNEIVILSPVNFKQSSASRLNAPSRKRIHVLTENSVQRFPLKEKIAYACLSDFAELESSCVILIDFNLCDLKEKKFELYLGMSCANSILSLIVSRIPSKITSKKSKRPVL